MESVDGGVGIKAQHLEKRKVKYELEGLSVP